MPRKKKVQIDVDALLKSSTKHYLEQLKTIEPLVIETEYYRQLLIADQMIRILLEQIPVWRTSNCMVTKPPALPPETVEETNDE